MKGDNRYPEVQTDGFDYSLNNEMIDQLYVPKADLRKLRKGLSLIIDNQGCTCSYRYTCTRCSLDIWKDDFDKLLDGK